MADNLFDPSRLYQALVQRGLLPEWSKGVSPETGEPAYYSALNRLFATDNRAELSHEMTHAVQHNLIQATAATLAGKKRTEKLTAQEQQFLDAFNKLTGSGAGLPGLFTSEQQKKLEEDRNKAVNALYYNRLKPDERRPEWDRYRTSPNEIQAWGVGNMSAKNKGFDPTNPKLQHLDPTLATEFDILLSMYSQLPESIKTASAAERKQNIEKNKKYYSLQEELLKSSRQVENPFYRDPFGSTIK
jgi:hypothetical protein